ncbi:MAG: carboxypeptidase regulatory-like domain-containing protein, partial [Bacteroidales bacterium]
MKSFLTQISLLVITLLSWHVSLAQTATTEAGPLVYEAVQSHAAADFDLSACVNRMGGDLYTNGPLANMPGSGHQGADASVVIPPLHVLAVPSLMPKRLVDNFTVTDQHWALDSVAFYEVIPYGDININYFEGYTVRIWEGYPGDPTSKVVWGDMNTNRLSSGKFSDVYRVEPLDVQSSQYPVYVNYCNLGGVQLPAGEYWIDWQSQPVQGLLSYSPYIACGEILATGNARSYDLRTNVYLPLVDETYPQGLPFDIFGQAVNPDYDVKMLTLLSPQSGEGLGAAEQVKVSVKNNGQQLIQSVPLQLWKNKELLATENAVVNLQAGDSVVYTFSQTTDLSLCGKAAISIVSCLEEDPFEGNNRLDAEIYHFSETVKMHNGSATTAAAWFTDSGGEEDDYQNNENYSFTFSPAATGSNPRMCTRMNFFDTERMYDTLYVYDGPTVNDPLLKVLVGGSAPEGPAEIEAANPGGALTFAFHSDDTVTRPGWTGTVECRVPFSADMEALAVSGKNFSAKGREQMFEVKVKNAGNLLQDDYTVEVRDDAGQVFGSIQGPELGFDETATVQVPVVFPETGGCMIHGHVALAGDEQPENNISEVIPVEVVAENHNVVEIRDENLFSNEFPLNPGFRSSLSEVIYFADELNASGLITGIMYKYKFWENNVSVPVRIWMGHTCENELTSKWIPSTELQLVFEGDLCAKFGIGLTAVNFDDTFSYDGTSNLVVMVERRFSYTVYPGNLQWGPNEFAMHEDTVRTGRSRFWKTSTALIHPENPRIGNPSDIVPYTAFTFDVSNEGSLKGSVTGFDGQPLAGVELTLEGTNLKTTTGFNGSYIFNDLPQGNQQLKAAKYAWNDTVAEVHILSGQQQLQDLQLSARQQTWVSGTINLYDRPWVAAEGAEVTLTGYGETLETTANAGGYFLFGNMYANTGYRLRMTYPDYQAYETDFFLQPSGNSLPAISLLEVTARPTGVEAAEINDQVEVSWDAGSSLYLIMYDDDTPEGQANLWDEGWAFAMRFTPLGYPCKPEKVVLHLKEQEIPVQEVHPFLIEVYDDDGPDGKPGTLLGTVERSANSYGWNEYDITELDILITEGEFYVAQRQMGPHDARAVLSTDYSQFELGRCYQNGMGSTWWGPQNFQKYMIRTWVNGPSEDEASDGFNVYRLLAGQENQTGEWELLSENQSEILYTDQNWQMLEWGLYRYAVKTWYTNGLLSDPAFSNMVFKNAFFDLDIQLSSNGGYLPENVLVSLTRANADTTISLNGQPVNGQVGWNGLIKGHYILEVSGRLFETYTDTLMLTENQTLAVELQEKALPATYVTAEDQSTTADIQWLNGPDTEQLILDDGWPEGNFGSNSGMDGYFGNLYPHEGQHVLLDAAVYFEFNPEMMQNQAQLVVFNADRQVIGASQSMAVEPEAWNTFTFTDVEVSGDFYVMVHFDYVDYPHYACLDRNGPNTGNNLGIVCVNGQWMLIDEYVSGLGDGVLMIRPTLYSDNNTARWVDEHALYRLFAGDEYDPQSWEFLVEVNGNDFSDPAWSGLSGGDYRYAVETRYTSGAVAPVAFSNVLTRLMAPANLTVNQQDESSALVQWELPQTNAELLGFNIYLDDLTQPEAFTEEQSFLFENLQVNVNYLAGVSAVYESGESDIQTTTFVLLPVGTGREYVGHPFVYPTVTDDV